MSQQSFQVQMELPNEHGDEITPVTIHFDASGDQLVGVRAFRARTEGRARDAADEGKGVDEEEYEVVFVIRKKGGGNQCWVCENPPCPPNRPVWRDPCIIREKA